ncbi:ATP-dependent DNA helicase RecG [Eubacterium sp. AF19-12LB]|uniref:ATP-dependent DNA helicase RecG n=1 Tax=Eubacterium sp. AF19-12LB TaxID=2293106 RepID=UPI000E4BF693|nr:ATP-dependent DNA helicase RecG [Eubacterium sp. AF19-12LB]RHR36488.1 ATP-dependent DNA helicase RecG [Eubacterium sp. AF19-12LB]
MNINELKGIGEKTEKVFNKAGIHTTDDLLKYYPRNYDIYEMPLWIRDFKCNQICAVKAIVYKQIEIRRVRNLQIVTAYLQDDTKNVIRATWFNAAYLKNTLKPGSSFVFRGMVKENRGAFVLEQPKIYKINEYKELLDKMQPIYPLVSGLTEKMVTKAVVQAIKVELPVKEYMPGAVLKERGLIDINKAYMQIHFPKNKMELKQAKDRIIFNEFFDFTYSLRKFKDSDKDNENRFVINNSEVISTIINDLPYKLTNAQLRTWNEIEKDMSGSKVMNRLIQGDVGSGKTIVATLALISAALSGYQGAIMVPTEVLARQHLESVNELIAENELNINTVLLTGSMKAKEKREACAKIESGEVSIIIGTHALIQDSVNYKNLALVITDEQHRFGVRQRESIANKGSMPHIIVMSATPIPRTLAIIMYGDLDISIIDELPANRLPIKNCVVGTNYRPNAYKFIEQQVVQGRQAYIICPTVEFSEAIEGENVIDYCNTLKNIFPPYINIEYLHGKMKPAMKNEIMDRFAKNEIQILVSTTVVEVGVNVPNATVMMIENAERFGLAGLHQLRGRVGRGKYQSYCIFINASETKKASERLEILNHSNNGFEIANEDLKLRGPGDFFGVRQSGDMEFKLGDIYSDASILKTAADMVNRIEDGEIEVSDVEKQRLDEYIDKYIYSSGLNI